jgi:hypothetical protein
MNKTIPLTSTPPKQPGYYWWTNRGEHTPTILCVERDGNKLFASNEEFTFYVSTKIVKNEYWAHIPEPELNGKIIKPDSL